MGGKQGSEALTTPPPEQQSGMEDVLPMMAFMMQVMSKGPEMPETPEITPEPEVRKTESIDWAGRQDELKNKARADYRSDQDGRKGRAQTILTSPLLDDEETETTTSIIAGRKE